MVSWGVEEEKNLVLGFRNYVFLWVIPWRVNDKIYIARGVVLFIIHKW